MLRRFFMPALMLAAVISLIVCTVGVSEVDRRRRVIIVLGTSNATLVPAIVRRSLLPARLPAAAVRAGAGGGCGAEVTDWELWPTEGSFIMSPSANSRALVPSF